MGDSEQSITLLFTQAEGEGGAESPSLEKHLEILNTVNLLLQPPPEMFCVHRRVSWNLFYNFCFRPENVLCWPEMVLCWPEKPKGVLKSKQGGLGTWVPPACETLWESIGLGGLPSGLPTSEGKRSFSVYVFPKPIVTHHKVVKSSCRSKRIYVLNVLCPTQNYHVICHSQNLDMQFFIPVPKIWEFV